MNFWRNLKFFFASLIKDMLAFRSPLPAVNLDVAASTYRGLCVLCRCFFKIQDGGRTKEMSTFRNYSIESRVFGWKWPLRFSGPLANSKSVGARKWHFFASMVFFWKISNWKFIWIFRETCFFFLQSRKGHPGLRLAVDANPFGRSRVELSRFMWFFRCIFRIQYGGRAKEILTFRNYSAERRVFGWKWPLRNSGPPANSQSVGSRMWNFFRFTGVFLTKFQIENF